MRTETATEPTESMNNSEYTLQRIETTFRVDDVSAQGGFNFGLIQRNEFPDASERVRNICGPAKEYTVFYADTVEECVKHAMREARKLRKQRDTSVSFEYNSK